MLIASAKILEREGSLYPLASIWASARLLVTHVSHIYLVDEFLFLFLLQLNETRRLSESKVLSFCFWC